MSEMRDEHFGLIWSSKPGCFERQLQRQYKNPLFPKELQSVMQAEVDNARRRDSEEADEFRSELSIVARSVASAQTNPETMLRSLFHLLREVHRLRIRAMQISGDLGREESHLLKLSDLLEEAILKAAPGQRERLYEIRRFHETRQEICSAFIAQVTRTGSPITPDRLIPALLAEDIETIREFAVVMEGVIEQYVPQSLDGYEAFETGLRLNNEEKKRALEKIQRAALDLVLRLGTRKEDAPVIADKLIALGVGQRR